MIINGQNKPGILIYQVHGSRRVRDLSGWL